MSGLKPEDITIRAVFKSNTWYRVNVLGEQLVYGHRNWAVNGNFGYPLEDKDWKNYYKGTTKAIVDISSEDPPFKNALRINQTTSAVAGIIDAVIWDGAVANDLVGKSVSMATWLKYQNITSGITMQIQVTGQKADGTFVNDYYKMFSYTGTDVTWKRQTGTAKIKMPDGANKVTRVLFKLGFTEAGTGEFWATGIQIETGTALGDWIPNPDDVQGDLEKTKAQLILTEKEIGFKVTKGEVIEEINLQPGQATIKAEKINFKGAVTFESFNPQVKSDFDAKATKTEAQGYANSAQTKAEANAKTNTEAVAKAKADLAETNAKAHADGKVTAEETRAIADAKAKLAEAQKYADAESAKVKAIADKAQKDATSAGTVASNAGSSATTANNLLADLANDNKLTASEKKETKKEWDIIVGEKPKIEAEATKYAIGTEKTTFVTRYNTLNSYISPLLTNLNATSDIVGTTFRTHFKNYYDARQDLLNAITSKAKQLADDAQASIDNLEIEGRNLVIRTGEKIGYLSGAGTIVASATGSRTMVEKIKVTPNETLTFTKKSGGSDLFWRWDLYNSSGAYTDRVTNNLNKFQWTVPSNTYEIQVSYPNVSEVQIERGVRATGYSPAPEDVDSSIEEAKSLANSASTLAGTKATTFITTPTTPYASGDVWRNGSAVYISTATRVSGAYVVADWVLVGDVTSGNTSKDTANVGGTPANTIKTQASNGADAYNSTSLWQTTGRVTIDGGQLTADTITAGAIKSDVALINKLFVSDANINVLTAKSAFINSIKTIDLTADMIKTGTLNAKLVGVINLDADKIVTGTISGAYSDWNLNTGVMNFKNPLTGDNLMLNQGSIQFQKGLNSRTMQYGEGSILIRPGNSNTGTALNTGLILEGGVTFLQFNNRAGTIQHGRLQMTSETAQIQIPNGAEFKILDMNGMQAPITANYFKTEHGTGSTIEMKGDSIKTPRVGNRNIYIAPNGTGSVVAGEASGTRYNMVASDFIKQSTRKSKTDIKPIETKGLDVIGRLNPVSYKKKDKVTQGISEVELGFIAEDSLEVATPDGEGIYDSHITAYLVKAVQELNEKIVGMENVK